MAGRSEVDNHIVVANRSVDVDHMTRQLERGNTKILEDVISHTNTTAERKHILDLVQQTNAAHRKSDANLPSLTVDNYSDWPSSWGRNSDLNLKRPGEKERTIYEVMDWTDRKKDHWIQKIPYKP